ncbi:Bug family tripartite tricarboxylate transporter substrate binding protein [Ramlibacter sp.]|uniref:Bug family tripartite tricarboxylate transporter substrate binding protein n=1 Tax=Ramlibacter sp. TaxID=1917967 RepID=UPI003D095D67
MNSPIRYCAAALFALGCLAATPAKAQDAWPVKPVRIVVPTAPGLASDQLARMLAEHFTKAFGQPFIVENKVGAGGFIAFTDVAKSPADGYKLVIASSGPVTISPAVLSKVAIDPVKDLAPIANIAITPQVILVGANSPYRRLADLTAAAKQKDLAFAIPPLGSTSHLAYVAFTRAANVKFNLVPFKGNLDGATQVMAGDVAAMYDTVPGALALVRGGKLRPLAVAAPQRSPFMPDTPTLAELGLPNATAVGWIGLAATAKTPAPILDKLNAEVRRFLEAPATRDALKLQAFAPADDTSRQGFERLIATESARWARIAKEANIRTE